MLHSPTPQLRAFSATAVVAPVRPRQTRFDRSTQRSHASNTPFPPTAAPPGNARPAPADKGSSTSAAPGLDLPCRTFMWQGHKINYVTAGCGEPLVLVHGFGACAGHFSKNIVVLSKQYKVYAIDLLGFGNADKPAIEYTMELWRDQVLDFMKEFVQTPAVLVGNSIGSLVCLMAAAQEPQSVRGLALLNCTGAMNNKGVPKDWRIHLAAPLIYLVDVILKSQWAAWAFEKYRSPENVRSILLNVYRNKAAVNDELVEMLYRPSCDPGAQSVFVSVLTGPPGPRPWEVVPQVSAPILVLWGDKDPFTPVDGPIGKYFMRLVTSRPETSFHLLKDVGHCPHDDRPEEVHEYLVPWLQLLPTKSSIPCETAAPAAAPGSTVDLPGIGPNGVPPSVGDIVEDLVEGMAGAAGSAQGAPTHPATTPV